MSEKIIRDPVHDVIAFRLEQPVDALLFRLINAVEFQRLRRIRQLGMANLAYPGADHSRYSHSLGVMQTARRIIDQLRRNFTIDEEAETICVVTCLLHDLGHGPFSHVFERISEIDHENLTRRVLHDPRSEVHQTLAAHDAQLPAKVVAFFDGASSGASNATSPRNFFSDILSSQLDADRFDYLLRDNLMTGSRYGDFDLNWLLHALVIDKNSNRLAISWKGISAVEAYLQARYHMYRNVYFHKVVRSAEGMVKLALQRAKRLAVQHRLEWPPGDSAVTKSLLGQELTIEEFTDLDDTSVMHCFKLWTKSEDQILAGLCHGLLFRGLFKTIDLTYVEDVAKRSANVASAVQAIEEAGGDSAYEMFYDEPADTPYETYKADNDGGVNEILVCDPQGNLTPFAKISPMSQALNRELMFRRIHVAPKWKSAIAAILSR